MNTKIFAFPQPASLSKVSLFQDHPTNPRHLLDTSNQAKDKPPKSSSVPALQARQYFTTVLLNKASKGGPELNLDILHLGGRKRTAINTTPDLALDMIVPKTSSSRATAQNQRNMQNSTRTGPLFSLPNLNLNTTMNSYPTTLDIFKNLLDPMNEIRGIEGVKLKEKEKETHSKSISSYRPFTRKSTLPTEATAKIEEEDLTDMIMPTVFKPKMNMPLVLNETFRKEQGVKSNKLTKRSNTGTFSQDGDDDLELSTAQIFHHHMEENGPRPKSFAAGKLSSIENLHFRKNMKKIFKSQGETDNKESHRSVDLNTTNNNNTSISHHPELKRQVSKSHVPQKNDLNTTATDSQDSLQGWTCIRPVRIISEKTARSESNQGKVQKQNFAIKTYTNGVFRSKKSVVKCMTEFDVKIAKIFKKDRTLEQNILSPLNESSSSEDDDFAEYVEAIKSESENILRSL